MPVWRTANGPAGRPSALVPGGHASPGIAHAITRPLALLSPAMKRGVIVPSHAATELSPATITGWQATGDEALPLQDPAACSASPLVCGVGYSQRAETYMA